MLWLLNSCWYVVSDDVILEAVTIVVLAIFIGQYCWWIGFLTTYNTWKLVGAHTRRLSIDRQLEKFSYCPHSCHIQVVLQSNALQYTDLNNVLLDWLWAVRPSFANDDTNSGYWSNTIFNWFLLVIQQKRPKTEERRAFENLYAHFGCAKNPLSIPERTECCKWAKICSNT
jgi:hypothetical protein